MLQSRQPSSFFSCDQVPPVADALRPDGKHLPFPSRLSDGAAKPATARRIPYG
jgi:hypothetical protein